MKNKNKFGILIYTILLTLILLCCSGCSTSNYRARRAAELECVDTKNLFEERFEIIDDAGLFIDKGSSATKNKVERQLKRHGLFHMQRCK